MFAGLAGGNGLLIEDVECRRCRFDGCNLGMEDRPSAGRRSVVRRVQMIDCEMKNCTSSATIFEDVLVDGLETFDLRLFACLFNRVELRGKLGRLHLSALDWNDEYSKKIDWALDIRNAEFLECELRGIPSRLIRRDEETQVLVRRERALEGNWRHLDLANTSWRGEIQSMLNRGDQELLLIAGKRDRYFQQELSGLVALRNAGIAE